jgi:hypothetical protein
VAVPTRAEAPSHPIPRAAGKKDGGAAGAGGAPDPAAGLERPVVNCLGCGKIYDARALSNDVLAFLSEGGGRGKWGAEGAAGVQGRGRRDWRVAR